MRMLMRDVLCYTYNMGKEVLYHICAIIKFFLFYLLGIFAGRKIGTNYIYLISAFAFLIGFILRWFNLYPGKFEPFWIDLHTFIISLFLFIFWILNIAIPLKYGLLFIISIHIIYNLFEILIVFRRVV